MKNNYYNKISYIFIKFSRKLSDLFSFIKNFKYKLFIIGICFLICIITFNLGVFLFSSYNSSAANNTLVYFFNVDQGDSILIKNPKFNILIDSGSNKSSKYLINYLKSLRIKTFDYVIATHPHEDHIGAMDDIINNFNIKNFIAPKVQSKEIDFTNMVNSLYKNDLKINTVYDNKIIELSNNNFLTFIWSGNSKDTNINNHSIAVKYDCNNISFLFTGDLESNVEAQLINNLSKDMNINMLNSDVLKIAHHGSNTSSTLQFLNAVNPKISIISCGMGNDYGHPHKDTISNLKSINSKIYRTDFNGTIILRTDGNNIWLNKEYEF